MWVSAHTNALTRSQLTEALSALTLTRDGAVLLEASCGVVPSLLGPTGSAMNHRGVIVATNKAVKDDGRLGAAYMSLSNKLPARSFVVLGPPSAMRAELSALDQVVADAPLDEELRSMSWQIQLHRGQLWKETRRLLHSAMPTAGPYVSSSRKG